MIAGMDWSMVCPAICIYDPKKPLTFENCTFYFLTDKVKFNKSFGNIHGFIAQEYSSEQERFDNISEWAMTILKKNKVREACLEGYSMGSKGKVFNIAENIGLLKHKMWKDGIEFVTPAPTQVKKHFTTKGNANKDLMYAALTEKNPSVKLAELLNCKTSDSPISDIVDSYAMVDYYMKNRG